MQQISRPANNRQLRWFLALPKLGIVLLLAAVIALLWMLHQNELDEERAGLIKDVLWLEQNLRFQLNGNEERLQQIAAELGNNGDHKRSFRLRTTHLLANNTEISHILWLDPKRNIIDSLPSGASPDSEIEAFGPTVTQNTFDLSKRLGKRVYSEPFLLSGNVAHFEIAIPIFSERQLVGELIAVYSLQTLLNQHVPWWFAEKYRIVVVDENETQFAAKSNIEGTPSISYDLPFDPPGYGLKLRVTSYKSAVNPVQRLLAAAILILAGGVFWSLWIVRDLMKKRSQAEQALRAEHAFRTAMEDSLTVGMRARDLEGRVIYVNPAFCKITGFSREELVGTTPPMAYWVPEQIDETFALHQAVLAGNAPKDGFEITFQRKNGEHFEALVYEAKLIDGNGQHTGWMASVLDISERKRTEDLARQQQEKLQFTSRLVTMGEMASTLAHELNQPLAAIASYNTGCLNLMNSADCKADEIRPALEKIGIQAQRAGKIIRRVHDFVRKSEPKRAPCQIAEVIDDCLGFVEADARKRHVHIECAMPELPDIMADRLMLEQVLLNLIRNGMDAMSDIAEPERRLNIDVICRTTDLEIQVKDQGCGIPAEIKDKLFTAFFTTKPDGMGVGLSICRSIIEFHRGRLWVEDNPQSATGSGTIFHITLPLENI
jgi:two-component system sensor histidine kinase DctS